MTRRQVGGEQLCIVDSQPHGTTPSNMPDSGPRAVFQHRCGVLTRLRCSRARHSCETGRRNRLRDLTGFAAERPTEHETDGLCGAGHGGPDQPVRRHPRPADTGGHVRATHPGQRCGSHSWGAGAAQGSGGGADPVIQEACVRGVCARSVDELMRTMGRDASARAGSSVPATRSTSGLRPSWRGGSKATCPATTSGSTTRLGATRPSAVQPHGVRADGSVSLGRVSAESAAARSRRLPGKASRRR